MAARIYFFNLISYFCNALMPRKRSLRLRCPICKKAVTATAPDFPFCSERCRLIDLGKWASGAYVITSPVTDAEEAIPDSNSDDQERSR